MSNETRNSSKSGGYRTPVGVGEVLGSVAGGRMVERTLDSLNCGWVAEYPRAPAAVFYSGLPVTFPIVEQGVRGGAGVSAQCVEENRSGVGSNPFLFVEGPLQGQRARISEHVRGDRKSVV